MAYKLEEPRTGSRGKPRRATLTEWDIYKLERHGEGPLTYLDPGSSH